ncbi:GerAB/ArcD/ProY family transporter [Bacillus tianshenii]|nr:GerAB/ArcD/ProY family transporter [Bacillus tianshenii]
MRARTSSITKGQLFFIIIQAQIGMGVMSLPHDMFINAKNDAWISLLIAGAILELVVFLQYLLVKRYPEQTIYEFMPQLLGKPFAKVVSLSYALFFGYIVVIVILLFTRTLQTWVLTDTPLWIIKIITISITAYLAKEQLPVIARFLTIVTLNLVFLVFFTFLVFRNIEIEYLFPIGTTGIKEIMGGANQAILALMSMEILYVYAFVQDKSKGLFKIIGGAIAFTTGLYLYLTLLVLVVFSPGKLLLVEEPLLYMLKSLKFTIIERLDLIFIAFWMFSVITTTIIYMYASARGFSKVLNLKSHSKLTWLLAAVILIVAFIPDSDLAVSKMTSVLTYISYLFVFVIPVFLLILSLVKKKDGSVKQKGGKQR